jgi:tRNA pseudouridine38-40 synthase
VNAVLPSDVRMFGVAVAGTGFHARFSATKRSYRYTIDNGRYAHPHLRRHAWHVGSPLDLNAMRAACSELIGVHDFVAFASREASGPTVRRVFGANVIDASFEVDEGQGGDRPGGMWQHRVCADPAASSGGGLIWIEVEANAFLRHMMRRIVGSLIRVGRGWMSPADIGSVLRRRVKAEAGPAAPPHGLNLFCVAYGDATVVDQA